MAARVSAVTWGSCPALGTCRWRGAEPLAVLARHLPRMPGMHSLISTSEPFLTDIQEPMTPMLFVPDLPDGPTIFFCPKGAEATVDGDGVKRYPMRPMHAPEEFLATLPDRNLSYWIKPRKLGEGSYVWEPTPTQPRLLPDA